MSQGVKNSWASSNPVPRKRAMQWSARLKGPSHLWSRNSGRPSARIVHSRSGVMRLLDKGGYNREGAYHGVKDELYPGRKP